MTFRTSENELTVDQLQFYGEKLTSIRLKYKEAALEALKKDKLENLDTNDLNAKKLAERIHKSQLNEIPGKLVSGNHGKVMENIIPPHLRRKGARRAILTQKEKLAIVHSAIVD